MKEPWSFVIWPIFIYSMRPDQGWVMLLPKLALNYYSDRRLKKKC